MSRIRPVSLPSDARALRTCDPVGAQRAHVRFLVAPNPIAMLPSALQSFRELRMCLRASFACSVSVSHVRTTLASVLRACLERTAVVAIGGPTAGWASHLVSVCSGAGLRGVPRCVRHLSSARYCILSDRAEKWAARSSKVYALPLFSNKVSEVFLLRFGDRCSPAWELALHDGHDGLSHAERPGPHARAPWSGMA